MTALPPDASLPPSPPRGGLWIFGGAGADGPLNDHWALDLANEEWERVDLATAPAPAPAPAPRYSHAFALESFAGDLPIAGDVTADGETAEVWTGNLFA